MGGLEEAVESDSSVPVGPEDVHTLFDAYLNVCPQQGSRTIRTEVIRIQLAEDVDDCAQEAVLVAMSCLQFQVQTVQGDIGTETTILHNAERKPKE